ncbi:hypothetical protein BC936DRAFT_138052, partial [Jimgerdemannia flammicorona]
MVCVVRIYEDCHLDLAYPRGRRLLLDLVFAYGSKPVWLVDVLVCDRERDAHRALVDGIGRTGDVLARGLERFSRDVVAKRLRTVEISSKWRDLLDKCDIS